MRLIDADTLIEKCGNWYVEEGTESGFIGTLKNLLVIQPTVQPNLQPTYNQLATDTISRQAAIEAVMECYDNDELFEVYEDKLRELPSAQSEIVRCKNCKHWIPYDWMFSEVWQSKNIADYPEDEIGCNYCDMTMKANDFCSRGERRTE